MEKPKRKLKIKFPLQPVRRPEREVKSDNEERDQLEEIVSEEPQKIKIPRENISSSLELGETLETQVANTPEAKKDNETSDQKPIYESIRYSANNSSYQESSYQTVNFTTPSSSLSSNSQENSFRNPLAGFHQANPFNPSGYPSAPEKNYESIDQDDSKRKRRM